MRETNSKKKLAGINKTLRKRFLDEKGCKDEFYGLGSQSTGTKSIVFISIIHWFRL
jgi:hypothetical protein